MARMNIGLRVRLAGVIDIAGDIIPHRAVDGPAVGQLEQIFVLDRIFVFLLRIQERPEIADDPGPLLDRLGGKEAESGTGTADAVRFVQRYRRHEEVLDAHGGDCKRPLF
jgi:hypothetical protein